MDCFRVTVSAKLEKLDKNEERRIEKMAKQDNGELSGSGTDFYDRDMNFMFYRESDMESFVSKMKKTRLGYAKTIMITPYHFDLVEGTKYKA